MATPLTDKQHPLHAGTEVELLWTLPAETDLRFRMLVVAAVMLTIHVGVIVATSLELLGPAMAAQLAAIEMGASVDQAEGLYGNLPDAAVAQYVEERRAYQLQVLRTIWPGFALPSLLLGIFWAVALAIYRTHPQRVMRGRHYEILRPADAPTLFADIARYGGSQLHAVYLYASGLNVKLRGRAFGLEGRYAIVIGGSRLTLPAAWKKAHGKGRAAMLHELGHIVQGDIRRGYFSKAIWLAFNILVAVPALLFLFILPSLRGFEGRLNPLLLLQFGAMVLVVWAIWASMNRVREHYADWWAAKWPSIYTPMRSLVATAAQAEQKLPQREQLWLRLPWANHPRAAHRVAVLEQPRTLFTLGGGFAFLTGLLLAIIVVGNSLIVQVIGMVLTALSETLFWSLCLWLLALPSPLDRTLMLVLLFIVAIVIPGCLLLAPAILTARLIAGVLGTQVAREALYAANMPAPLLGGGQRLALGGLLFSLGFAAGLLIMPLSPFFPQTALVG